jgi:hypothetical protein
MDSSTAVCKSLHKMAKISETISILLSLQLSPKYRLQGMCWVRISVGTPGISIQVPCCFVEITAFTFRIEEQDKQEACEK